MLVAWKAIPMASGTREGSKQGICTDLMSAVRVVTTADAVLAGTARWHNLSRA